MPAVTRIGDADVPHCSGMTRAVGSSNVFAMLVSLASAAKSGRITRRGAFGCAFHQHSTRP